MNQGQRSNEPLTKLITLREACLKREELKKQGMAYPTIMSVPGTDKYYVIEGRAAKKG